MSISVIPILPAIGAQSAAPDLVLEPGTVVDAQVLKILSDNLVRIAISNLSIDVLTEVPLAAGQTLQLAVSQTATGIRLAVVGQGATASSPESVTLAANATLAATATPSPLVLASTDILTPLERVAVSAAVASAASRQDSLAPLFANLGVVAQSSGIPAKLQQAVMQVLGQRTSLDPALSGNDVKNAVQKSGIFFEASLAAQLVSPASGVPDLKAALIVLRQTLVSTLGSTGAAASSAPIIAPSTAAPQPALPGLITASAGEPATPPAAAATPTFAGSLANSLIPSLVPPLGPEMELPARALIADDALEVGSTAKVVLTANPVNALPRAVASDMALNLLEKTLQPLPEIIGEPSPAAALQNASTERVTFHSNTPPPPFRGALPSAQPIAESSIASNAPLATSAHHLLGDTDAAIARQTLLQVASLPDRVDMPGVRADPVTARWNFEIPFATPQGTAMAQFEISREGGGTEVEGVTKVWRARFSLDVEPAGPVHALISLSNERTSVRMWAERPATAAQLRAGVAQLSEALGKAELQPGDIVIREGAPPQQRPARAGHFLDRAL
jgi:hypothetical protein